MGRPRIKIEGNRFGKLTVLHRVKDRYTGKTKHPEVWYRVRCDCGRKRSTRGYMIRTERVSACEVCKPKGFRHGMYGTPQYRLWRSAKSNTKKDGIKFSLTLRDIIIPEKCPLLLVDLVFNAKGYNDYSPSIDRIDPNKGYIKDNIWVVSHRANKIKNDATIEELFRIALNLKKFVEEKE